MDALTLLKTRRSIRKFQKAPFPKEDLDEILRVARCAPSGGNAKPWRVTILDTPEKIQRVYKVISEDRLRRIQKYLQNEDERQYHIKRKKAFLDFMTTAPVWVCFSYKQISRYLEKLLEPDSLEAEIRQWHVNSPLQSAAAAVLQLLLAAHALGYGGCWMSAPLLAREALHEKLEIRSPWELMAIVPLGKPAKESHRQREIEALESFVEFPVLGD